MTAIRAQFIEIPLGTIPARCRSCGAVVYFVRTRRGSLMPVSIAADGCRPPDTFPEGQQNLFGGLDTPAPGLGISHFADCPDAPQWSSRGAR